MASGAAAFETRRAGPGDRDALERLIRAYYAYDGHPFVPERIGASLDAIVAGDPSVHVWLVDVEGAVVGYLAVTLGFSIEAGGRDAFLDELYLDEAVRGRGIGRQLLDFAVARCAELGVRRLTLEVEHHNDGARRLYADHGFAVHERHLMSRWIEP